MRRILLILVIVSLVGTLTAYSPPTNVSSPGDPCNFSYQCLGNCGLDESDAHCICNFGKCQVELKPNITEETYECDFLEDCSCRDTPLNCYCDHHRGKCRKEPVECHENDDCKRLPKCAGKVCSCAGRTCEHECTTTQDCYNEKYQFYCARDHGPDYTCKCEEGLCMEVDSGRKICGPLDRWKDCHFCPDGGSVLMGCKRCSCLNGKPGPCTQIGCLPPARECRCTKEINIVCAADGNTYSNPCQAECKGAEIKCPGECPCRNNPNCPCNKLWDPRCGVDGKTYANGCLAYCAGVREKCSGPCPCKEGYKSSAQYQNHGNNTKKGY